jgi:hypothetical protein
MTTPNAVVNISNLVCRADRVVVYKAYQIMAYFKEHYEGLFNYDPKNVSYNTNHWNSFDFGNEH